MPNLRSPEIKLGAMTFLILLSAAGCGGGAGPGTHPVQGQVRLADRDVKVLAGHCLEAALMSDPLVRAYGEIQEDGGFALVTYRAGVISQGVLEGEYRARIVLSDDDVERRRQAAEAIDARYLDFDASGLTFQAPAGDFVTLDVIRR